MPQQVLEFVGDAVRRIVREGDVCVDATLGTGRDALLLARLVGRSGHVYGFDVQQEAVDRTRSLLSHEGVLDRATTFLSGHENAAGLLPVGVRGNVAAVMFNLGYLPESASRTTTAAETTVRALVDLWPFVRSNGLITVVVYRGHPGGREEATAVLDWMETVARSEGRAARYRPIGTREPAPEALVLRKRSGVGSTERKTARVE